MSQSPIMCKIDHDRFCFVCGEYILKRNSARSIESGMFPRNYHCRFGLDLKERDVMWSPGVCCAVCRIWINDQTKPSPFSAPTLWNRPQNHPDDCSFCNVEIPAGINQYTYVGLPNVSSVVKAKIVQRTSDEDESVADSMDIEHTEFDAGAITPHYDDDDFEAPLDRPSTSRGIYEKQSIASILIDALKPFAEVIHEDPVPIATALLNALQPLTTSQVNGLQPISTALVNALTEISNEPHQYGFRQRSSVRYDDIESEKSSVSSFDQWQPPIRVLHEMQLKRRTTMGPKLTQSLLNDIVRDCSLSKDAAKMLASRLVQLYKVFDPSIMNGMFKI